jgi:peroxiredoxin
MADTDQGRQRQQSKTTGILKAGTPAPEFTLNTTPDQRVSLSDFRGQPVVLAFYPADWSPVCGDQMALYNGVWCHGAFTQARRLHFPLLADFEPKGAVARTYGAYRKREGVAERALFVLDGEGTIVWSYLSPIGVNPGADGILEALESLPAKSQTD